MNPRQLQADLLGFLRGAFPNISITVEPWAKDAKRLAITFIEPGFATLYQVQRYHRLIHLIPAQYYEKHLNGTIWYELAPGEKPEDLQHLDDETTAAITADVMRCVTDSRVLEALDDAMCPAAPGAERARCHGDFRLSRQIFRARGFKEEELFDIYHVLMAQGGFCDCEILYNVAETSRLKAEYWRARLKNSKPYDPHAGA